jgi:ATP-dependent DNA helicase RecQ
VPPIQAETAMLTRFGLAMSDAETVRLVVDAEDEGLQGLVAATALDAEPRQVFEPAAADGVLLKLTDHEHYRSAAQKSAARALLTQPAGSGLMVSMPTGSGKSLLFQIAALQGRRTQPGACVVVITPTIALAMDHARTLSGMQGLEESRALTGDTAPTEANAIVDAFRRGEIPVLLLSPEKALNPALAAHLAEAATGHSPLHGLDARLTHLFVDEAHIVESWGRSFRPDFQRLPSLLSALRQANPEIRAVLLSATLPLAARQVLQTTWRLQGDWLEVDAHTPRYEHDIVVAHYPGPAQRSGILDHVIDRAPRPLIVYVTEVGAAEALHAHLTATQGYGRTAVFTGETNSRDRARIIRDWAVDKLDLVVATSAFGMGIDKPDVRSVIHVCLPESPARWYQEIGRASRDGGQGLAVCLFTDGAGDSDVSQAFGLASTGWLTREKAVPRWRAMIKLASNLRWEEGRRRMTLDLDVVREGLKRHAGDYNRGWNRGLLTLMQRAGALTVLSVPIVDDQPTASWDIELLEPALMAEADADVWDHIFSVRDAERLDARRQLEPFVENMLAPLRACLTQSTFQLIEPDADVPPCGRCPSCRRRGVTPPRHLKCDGLEKAWPQSALAVSPMPPGLTLLAPEDDEFGSGFDRLLDRLVGTGIEQFIVPRKLADRTAGQLALSRARLGLIMADDDWRGDVTLARIPTAAILPDDPDLAREVLARLSVKAMLWAETPIVVVARPSRVLDDRRLDQTVSPSAPLSEDQLDVLALAGSEAA